MEGGRLEARSEVEAKVEQEAGRLEVGSWRCEGRRLEEKDRPKRLRGMSFRSRSWKCGRSLSSLLIMSWDCSNMYLKADTFVWFLKWRGLRHPLRKISLKEKGGSTARNSCSI